jgi:hypothetical protein
MHRSLLEISPDKELPQSQEDIKNQFKWVDYSSGVA